MISPDRNPFRRLRTRQGISQYELARRCGISKHAVLRLEQGTFANPLPSVVNYFTTSFPKDYPTPALLVSQYSDFQYEVRSSNSRLFGNIIDELKTLPVGTHPLVYLRTNRGISSTGVAKQLCIAQNTVYYFENSPIHQHTVPEQLIHALWDADYTEAETDALKEAYAEFRSWVNDQKRVSNE